MRKTHRFAPLNGIWTKGAALLVCMLMTQALCFLLPRQALAEGEKRNAQKQAHDDYVHLAGKWVRPDGGYVMEIKEAQSGGRLKVLYFNPKSINVSKAEWRRMGDFLQVFVELRDANYPGSTYTLVFSREHDSLEGYYYQAALGQTFEVVFRRMK